MLSLDRHTLRLTLTAGLLVGLLGLTAGCYERVVSSKTYPGWNPTGHAQPPTAPDYSNVEMVHKKKKAFDPIGDFIVKPIGGAFKSVGNAFAGDDSSDSDHNDGRDGSRAGDKTTSQGAGASGVQNPENLGNPGGTLFGTSGKSNE